MVVIFRGVSGSGKSTLAKILLGSEGSVWDTRDSIQKDCEWAQYMLKLRSETKDLPKKLFSADNYFTDEQGNYNFNAKYLSQAHNSCLQKFIEEARTQDGFAPEPRLLIVDNTNCSVVEVAAYAQIAQAYQHELKIITLLHDPEDCAKRNKHKVPTKNIVKQFNTLDDSLRAWPLWWPQEIFFV